MSNISFTCPHCNFQKQLPASSEGMQGNCPSCKAVVTISADAPANPSALPQQPLPQQPALSVSNSSQPKNWVYEAIKSDLDDSVLHTFRTTSISGTDKYGHPIDLFVRFGNGTTDILIDWKGTCFADAHSTFHHAVSMRCGSAEPGACVWSVTNDLTGTILAADRANYCVRSFLAIEKAVFSVQAYHDNRIDAVFNVSGLFEALQSTVPNPKPGVLPYSTYPQLADLPANVDHGWVSPSWTSPEAKVRQNSCVAVLVGGLLIFLLLVIVCAIWFA